MSKNIIVTGGSGVAGKWVVADLLAHGHSVLNLDKVPLTALPEIPGASGTQTGRVGSAARTLITDLTDAGQVFNALASTTALRDLSPSLRSEPIDAVIHFAAIPRIMERPDNEVYRVNVMSTYNVLDAAAKFGIKKVILASSETAYGIVFADTYRDPVYLPLDEDYPADPMDSYAMSKLVNEVTAKAFHTRTASDIYCLRIGNVIEPHDYAKFPEFFKDPGWRRRIVWSYIDARDLATAARLAVDTDGLGFQVMNVAADDVSSDLPTAELLKRFYPNVPVKRALREFETLLANDKIKRLLGFAPQHRWREHVAL
ncbi:MAG: NAD(P)-dependent oxidoreductase [Pseudorhodobacter sp.]|nr:NAD(P)-dependent oxidoreductase [Rhizobacter sp.]